MPAIYHGERCQPPEEVGVQRRRTLEERIGQLPPQTQYTTRALLRQLENLEEQIQDLETRMREVFEPTPETPLLDTPHPVLAFLSHSGSAHPPNKAFH